ncbi:DUF6531 domain-containing protein [Escherichia coli]|jgi:hypothetical protein|uniref:RHS Repeat family protein,Uncharacterized conserved protein,RHS repeat-associated core domain n=3 Tax=Escherichia coli TaxID=562 RepID=A0A7I9A7F5_ECOLX|nr:hypothetical protein [Escherichia coli]EMX23199.1 putative core protein [Escherichia coli P0301867.1]EMX91336.1 putative core protein [Escherichia coli 2719100]ENA42180.1 putative core protein [Escherichia coli P0301867.4]ENA47727.1 putative core protein [Escherichia coli P0301867.2]ENC92069.1 putative core protein [Escherichia coli P0301867.11]END97109.1 putative core protein [Escherichia coli P0301867.13]ENH00688.1 putative core protein [Escherichia coli P0301867.3]ENH05403.1 putative 
MGGKPAARQGDMTRKGLDIVQGSAGVLIGAPTGVACSVCPGGITYANPVNPLLGAKVLPGETDLALPGPLPFILSRAYSSYRTRTPAPVGVFGPGWKAPFDIRLQIRDEGLILNDNGGRSIHFEPLFPGEISYSRSESLWLARGGVAEQHSSQPLSALWQVLPEDVRLSPHVYLATNSLQGPWWILSWPERVPGADEVLPPEPPAYITQDPIGLRGEWNLYKYPLNPVRFIDSLGLKFHVNGDPSDFNQAVEYLKQDSQMKETIDFLSSSEETINIEYIEGTNVRFNSNNMTIYWNSRASLFCSTELNSKSQSPALGLGHEFAHAQYYLLDKENFMALLSRTDKKYENKEEARVITIIESRAAKTLGECTRGAHSGLPFYRVDGPLQTMKITGTPE